MLRLRTLGTLSISANDIPLGAATSRRRSLALLALAASASEAGVSDEHALALLWADSDTAHARSNLKQVVFTLRQAIGKEPFVRNAGTLRLDLAIYLMRSLGIRDEPSLPETPRERSRCIQVPSLPAFTCADWPTSSVGSPPPQRRLPCPPSPARAATRRTAVCGARADLLRVHRFVRDDLDGDALVALLEDPVERGVDRVRERRTSRRSSSPRGAPPAPSGRRAASGRPDRGG